MFRILPLFLLSGCCCCWPFGSDDNSGGFVSGYVGDRLGEEIGEQMVERMTGADNIEVNDDGSVDIRTADGAMRMSGNGDGTLPTGFPITPYAGSSIVATMEVPDGTMVTTQSAAPGSDLVTYYRDELSKHGDVQNTMDMAAEDGRMVVMTVTAADGATMSVMVIESAGEPTMTTLTIGSP